MNGKHVPGEASELRIRIGIALSVLAHREPSEATTAVVRDVLMGKTIDDFMDIGRMGGS